MPPCMPVSVVVGGDIRSTRTPKSPSLRVLSGSKGAEKGLR